MEHGTETKLMEKRKTTDEGFSRWLLQHLEKRRTLIHAMGQHAIWLSQLKTKYPVGSRGGIAAPVRIGTKFQERLQEQGSTVVFEAVYDSFKYNNDEWLRMTRPALNQHFPYLRYVCTCVPDSRDSHREKHNIVLRKDHPFWLTWWPPNGLGCLCFVTSVSESKMKSRGYKVARNLNFKFPAPDLGFDFNVGELFKGEQAEISAR
jgi:hypothetical protein